MTNIAVLVSGGGTNLQAIIDSVADGSIRNVRICAVISNNKHAFALERARKAGIEALCVSPKDFEIPRISRIVELSSIRTNLPLR